LPDGFFASVEGVELVLEPDAIPPAHSYQRLYLPAGIPATAFTTSDIAAEYQRLKALVVNFRGEPTNMRPIISAIFEDTCGNLINPSTATGLTSQKLPTR
jgi:Glyoxalase/Bleomycin resistance protein/Dioxygenase superfamily